MWEGSKAFLKSTAIWTGIGTVWTVVFHGAFQRGRHMLEAIRGDLPANVAIASLFGLWDASKMYHETKRYNEAAQMAELAVQSATCPEPGKPHHAQRIQAEKLAQAEQVEPGIR
jgi:hypothetical protein